MKQPILGEVNQSRKQCWGCDVFIPYEYGFCNACWALLSETEQEVVALTVGCSPTFGGQVRSAAAQRVKDLRRPPREAYRPIFEKKVKRELPSIELDLGDLL